MALFTQASRVGPPFARLCYVTRSASTNVSGFSSPVLFAILVVHPASLCDVCLDPYITYL